MPGKDYYWRHREKCIADVSTWKKENPEKARKNSRNTMQRARATEEGRVRTNANTRRWAKANPEKVKTNYAKWKERNPDYNKKYLAKRYAAHPASFMLNGARQRAKRTNVPFSITLADIVVPTVCPVFGIEIKPRNGPFKPDSISLDRMIPELGYVPGNVQVISLRANILKRDGTLDEFRKIVAYMERVGAT